VSFWNYLLVVVLLVFLTNIGQCVGSNTIGKENSTNIIPEANANVKVVKPGKIEKQKTIIKKRDDFNTQDF
jgi:hypothetical protein